MAELVGEREDETGHDDLATLRKKMNRRSKAGMTKLNIE